MKPGRACRLAIDTALPPPPPLAACRSLQKRAMATPGSFESQAAWQPGLICTQPQKLDTCRVPIWGVRRRRMCEHGSCLPSRKRAV